MNNRSRITAAAIAIGLVCGLISGCSDSSSSTDSDDNKASTARANDLVRQWSARPTSIGITAPINGAIASGKVIAYVNCGLPACDQRYLDYTAAAERLGWKIQQYRTSGTSESVTAAWDKVVADRPDGVISVGKERTAFTPQLAKLKAAKIPVVSLSVTDKVGDGLTMVLGDAQESRPIGEIMAAWATADGNGSANTLFVDLPGFDILKPLQEQFEESYASLCSGCVEESINIPATSIGKDVPERIVSYLRAHPKVDHVALAIGDLSVGLPAALQQAGLQDKVKIIAGTGNSQVYSYIAGNKMEAVVAIHSREIGWATLDTFARYFAGESLSPDADASYPLWLVTKDNLVSPDSEFPLVADYQRQFAALWGQ